MNGRGLSSRRAAFMVDHSRAFTFSMHSLGSLNPKPAQAEGLLIMGEENVVDNVTIIGSGATPLQANGSVYLRNTSVTGIGDNILGPRPCFF
ncbi:MAG: hypothetical protein R3B47_16255 [Bacteroidia bacterium]